VSGHLRSALRSFTWEPQDSVVISGLMQMEPEAEHSFAFLAVRLLLALLMFTATACGGGDSGIITGSSFSFTTPAIVSATGNPQVAEYSVALPSGASAKVEFGPTAQYGLETSGQTAASSDGQVNFLIAGMLANTTYHMRTVVHTADGRLGLGNDQTFTTGGLPLARMLGVSVAQTGLLTPSPGVELLGLIPLTGDQINMVHTVALDLKGNLIWYYDPPDGSAAPFPVKLLPNGHMLINLVPRVNQAFTGIREIDLAGNTVSQISQSDLNSKMAAAKISWTVSSIHHDFLTLSNGHLILLVNYSKAFQDLPGFPGQTQVLGRSSWL